MYIKTLTIQGFKSYRDQTLIEPFSPRHNVVVGRNGSGKSNFFAAIRFVLSDAYTSMTREERQSLLHEGVSTTTTLSAFVEIVFDNSDNRFPTGHDEVILRRTIGHKKDDYILDKKSASKADVMNLLESAGFSKSNPYYIVPQGRITALTNAKEHERLALLKEVAGTKVYEQRRTESLRTMAEAETRRAKITESLEYLESRLEELEEEKEELKEFQAKDKERRCLEYALYQRDLEEVGGALDEIEDERKNEVHSANVRREKYNERQQEIRDLEKRILEAKHSLDASNSGRQDAQAELTELTRARTELQCTVDDLKNTSERVGGQREDLEQELEQISTQIHRKEAELAQLTPKWEAQRAAEIVEKKLLEESTTRLSSLFAKQGRVAKFKTKAERDSFLKGEITSLEAFKVTQSHMLEETKLELSTTRQSLAEVETQIANLRERMDDGRVRVTELAAELLKQKEKYTGLTEERKDLWREDTKLETSVSRTSDELRTAERSLASMMDKDTGSGLRAVDKIAEQHAIPGVFGPLYRLFEVADHKYNTAIELTAGNSLFHIVVDTDTTASRLLEIMLKEKTGRVTFMPLNRLKPKNPNMPIADDAIPILHKLEYDPTYEKAFLQVFGKTCVCRDLSIAAGYVKSHGINTITLDGDKVDRKGALTGGYHDIRRSRIEAIKSVTMWRSRYEETQKKSKETRGRIGELDQRIGQVQGQMTVLTHQQTQIRDARDRSQQEGISLMKEKTRLVERIGKLENSIEELENELRISETKLDVYKLELLAPVSQGLTDAEITLIDTLGKEIEQHTKKTRDLSRLKTTLEGHKNTLEIELNETLRRRHTELQTKIESIADIDVGVETDDLELRLRELRTLTTSINDLSTRVQEMEDESEVLNGRIQADQKALEKIQTQQSDDTRMMSRQQKTTERYLAKRQMLLGRKDDCNRSIRDLGVLPEEAFQKYTSEKMDRLVKKLHSVNDSLKKFSHVNKKAFEQYNNFTKERDEFLRRREELDKAAESITELVEVLDQRKDEAIERTFKQVARNFEEVFGGLVPSGRGRLIIQRRIDQEDDQDQEEEGEDAHKSSIDNYTGVSIKVSFNSKVDEGLRIQQLSGGQKSLVALATVFAIQKCDPAPFYLFDEIDANLDAQYRTAVASMIHSLSTSAQFITTTFRPEMLVTADKFYGVLFNNQKISTIKAIRREEAMEFVDQEARAQ